MTVVIGTVLSGSGLMTRIEGRICDMKNASGCAGIWHRIVPAGRWSFSKWWRCDGSKPEGILR